TGNPWTDVTYGNGRFVAVADSGTDRVMYSTDATSWTDASAAAQNAWQGVLYANGRYYAFSSSGTNRAMVSEDGSSWSEITLTTTNGWGPATYGQGRIVGVADNGTNRAVYADAGFGEDTPITLFVDNNGTDATTLTYGLNHDAGTSTITADLYASTTILKKPSLASSSNEITFDDRAVYDSFDDTDILFTATTSTTTVNADLYIDASTTVYAPQNLVIDGDFANYGMFYAELGEVLAQGTAQVQYFTGNFSATSSLWNLTVGDTATVSPAATTEVDNDYHVGGSAAGPYAGLIELTGTSTLSGTGNFGFVEVQGSASSTETEATFTDLTIASGGDFTAPSGTLTITGDFDPSAGSFDVATATTYFGGQGTYGTEFTYLNATSVAAQDGDPNGLAFSPDGVKLYMAGYNSNNSMIYEYTLSTPWDIATASFVQSSTTATQDGFARGLYMTADGSRLYTTGDNTNVVLQYTLTTPWDISTMAFVSSTSTTAYASALRGMALKKDGSRLYVLESGRTINDLELTTPYDITTARFVTSQVLADGSPTSQIRGMKFGADGRTIFTSRDEGGVVTHALATPWDVSTQSLLGTLNDNARDASSRGIALSSDGRYVYIAGGNGDSIYQFDVTALIGTSTASNKLADVIFSASGTSAFTGPASTTDFTIGTNATVTAPSGTLTLGGLVDIDGVFDANDGTVAFSDPGPYSLEAYKFRGLKYIDDTTDGLWGAVFSATGSRVYAVEIISDTIHQYDLATPWDITTASYTHATSVGAFETNPRDVRFKTDGTKMFVVGSTQGAVEEYALSTPWDISTAAYTDRFFVNATDTPYALDISQDGRYLYTTGTGAEYYWWEMSTPWDITSTQYLDVANNLSVLTAGGVTISNDGTRLTAQTTGGSGFVKEYVLTTPYDVTTAVLEYDNIPFGVYGDPGGLTFSQDGRYALYSATGDSVLFVFELASVQDEFDATNPLNNVIIANGAHQLVNATTSNFSVSTLGTYIASSTSPLVITGSLTNNGTFDANQATITLSGTGQTVSGDFTGDNTLDGLNIDGSYTFANNATVTDLVIESGGSLSAPSLLSIAGNFTNNGTFDAGTGTTSLYDTGFVLDGERFEVVEVTDKGISTFPYSLRIKPDGTKFYIARENVDTILEYDLSTPFDFNSASYLHATSVANQDTSPFDVAFGANGTKMYVAGANNDAIYEYDLTTAWDVSSASYLQSTSTSLFEATVFSFEFSPDGTRLYTVGAGDEIDELALGTPWDISTASYVQNLDVSASLIEASSGSRELRFSPDGQKLFFIVTPESFIHEYTLSTPWDISTATATDSIGLEQFIEPASSQGFTFSPDGNILYIGDNSAIDIVQVTLADAHTLSGTMTGVSAFNHLEINSAQLVTFGSSASTTGTMTITDKAGEYYGATSTIFTAGAQYTFQNIDWQGGGTDSELMLRSSASGTQWVLDVPGSQLNVQYVDVQDSDATPSASEIVATNSTDSGNNTNWNFSGGLADEWNATDWTLYDTITIRHENIDSPLTDFPVYVDLSDLSAQFWTTVLDGGGDIRVTTDEDTPQELPREVVSASTASTTGELHFKADYISEVIDTSFRIYYNGTDADYATDQTYGAENVWSNNYVAVWHLEEGDSTTTDFYLDSTANDYDGTMSDADGDNTIATGQLGRGIDFGNDFGDMVTTTGMFIGTTNNLTISGWVNPIDNPSTHDGYFGFRPVSDGANALYILQLDGAGNTIEARFRNSATTQYDIDQPSAPTITPNQWNYLNAVLDGTTARYYDNGTETATSAITGNFVNTNAEFFIGALHSGPNLVNAGSNIDEVRISSTTRSAAWIKAEYYNQSTTTDFYFLEAGTGSTTLSDHDAGQVDNAFNFQNQTNEALFAFKLTPNSGNATVTRTELTLSGARKVNVGDFSNIRLYADNDNDAEYDAGDTLIDGSGVMSLSGTNGDILFNTDYLLTTATNYVVVADWNAPERNTFLTIDLHSDRLTLLDSNGGVAVLGGTDRVQHDRSFYSGGNGTGQADFTPPAGQGVESGGGEEAGELIGNDPDYNWPSSQSGAWSNGDNAIDETDGTYTTDNSSAAHQFSNHSFGVNPTNVIDGIEVRLEVSGTTAAGDIAVDLSWDGGTSWTSTKTTPTLTTSDVVVTLGGATDTWGRAWVVSEFSDANFRVRLTGNPSSNTVRLDAIQVRIYNRDTGGGGGGGGAI
ncbi:MAG: hypothetical protein DWQ49_12510, partial [Bacteroidetes bacterium]